MMVYNPNETGRLSMQFGYARVSSNDQNLDSQIAKLKAAGCERIHSEKVSGTSREGRAELATLMDFIRQGDVLTVTRIDRLARSVSDLQDIVSQLKAKGASLKVTEQPIDTGNAAGKMFFDILGAFAEFETALRRERQLDGIARAKEEDLAKPKSEQRYKGRPATIEVDKVLKLKADGMGATAIAKQLKIGRASVYRALAEA